MRKILYVLTVIIIIFTFSACGSRSAQDIVSDELDINASTGIELSNEDTHLGFQGEGTTYMPLVLMMIR